MSDVPSDGRAPGIRRLSVVPPAPRLDRASAAEPARPDPSRAGSAATRMRPTDSEAVSEHHAAAPRHRRARRPRIATAAHTLLSPSHAHDNGDPYMNLRTLSAYSGLSVRKLRAVLKDATHPLPHYRLGNAGKVLVRQSAFDAWMTHYRVEGDGALTALVDEVLDAVTDPATARSA